MGSLLIQSEDATGEPLLLHLMLPTCIRQRHLAERAFVFLLDAQIGTGAAAFMAIRVLLDHGVPEQNIICLLTRSKGTRSITSQNGSCARMSSDTRG